jgi:predicted nucleotidyltransferase
MAYHGDYDWLDPRLVRYIAAQLKITIAGLRKLRNNLRIMRKSNVLASLFPETRRGILSATLPDPDKWWYLSELAQHLRTTPSSLQRELAALVESEILEQRTEGRRTYFRPNRTSPIFPDLRSIFEKTIGLIPSIRAALRPFSEDVVCAFVYGSVARNEERSGSDVDLMVIGDVGLADLTPVVRKLERSLRREVNVTTYPATEFRDRVRQQDHFLGAVLNSAKQFVIGDESALARVIGEP